MLFLFTVKFCSTFVIALRKGRQKQNVAARVRQARDVRRRLHEGHRQLDPDKNKNAEKRGPAAQQEMTEKVSEIVLK